MTVSGKSRAANGALTILRYARPDGEMDMAAGGRVAGDRLPSPSEFYFIEQHSDRSLVDVRNKSSIAFKKRALV